MTAPVPVAGVGAILGDDRHLLVEHRGADGLTDERLGASIAWVDHDGDTRREQLGACGGDGKLAPVSGEE
jgi:hypothetical protein